MLKQINQKSGTHTKIIAVCISALLLLAAVLCIVGNRYYSVNAATDLTNGETTYKIPTNIDGEFLDCTMFVDITPPAAGDCVFTIFLPKTLADYELISLVYVGSGAFSSFSPTKSGDGNYRFTRSWLGTFPIEDFVAELVKRVPLPPDPIKEGYTFTGWYLDSACTIPYDGSPILEDTALYAGFKINTYTVTFDSDGGSAVANITVDWNTAATLTTPIRVGYNFLGWFLQDGTQYTNQPIKVNTDLIAKWEVKLFTVTFYVDDKVHKTLVVPYGSSLNAAVESAQMQDYALMSITLADGEKLSGSNMNIFSNAKIEVAPLTAEGETVNTVQKYWYIGLIGIVFLAFLISLPFITKKKSR